MKLDEIERQGKNLPSKLEEAAVKAHELTMALRKQGVEAYEFHDRYESIVTVGWESLDRGRERRNTGRHDRAAAGHPAGRAEKPSDVQRLAAESAPEAELPGQDAVGLVPALVERHLLRRPADARRGARAVGGRRLRAEQSAVP